MTSFKFPLWFSGRNYAVLPSYSEGEVHCIPNDFSLIKCTDSNVVHNRVSKKMLRYRKRRLIEFAALGGHTEIKSYFSEFLHPYNLEDFSRCSAWISMQYINTASSSCCLDVNCLQPSWIFCLRMCQSFPTVEREMICLPWTWRRGRWRLWSVCLLFGLRWYRGTGTCCLSWLGWSPPRPSNPPPPVINLQYEHNYPSYTSTTFPHKLVKCGLWCCTSLPVMVGRDLELVPLSDTFRLLGSDKLVSLRNSCFLDNWGVIEIVMTHPHRRSESELQQW